MGNRSEMLKLSKGDYYTPTLTGAMTGRYEAEFFVGNDPVYQGTGTTFYL